jgi:DnaJ-domain-containing protein 1
MTILKWIIILLFYSVAFVILFIIPYMEAKLQAEIDASKAEEEELLRRYNEARERYNKARERRERYDKVVSYTSYTQEMMRIDLRNLGLTAPATKQSVKDAYRSLAKKYHPDVYTKGDRIFKDINASYGRLMKEVYHD